MGELEAQLQARSSAPLPRGFKAGTASRPQVRLVGEESLPVLRKLEEEANASRELLLAEERRAESSEAETRKLRARLEEETDRLIAIDLEVACIFSSWHRASLDAEALRQEHRSTARQLGELQTELVSKRRVLDELRAKVVI